MFFLSFIWVDLGATKSLLNAIEITLTEFFENLVWIILI
jgi:hypothetical protein